jgi:hypothetical protein
VADQNDTPPVLADEATMHDERASPGEHQRQDVVEEQMLLGLVWQLAVECHRAAYIVDRNVCEVDELDDQSIVPGPVAAPHDVVITACLDRSGLGETDFGDLRDAQHGCGGFRFECPALSDEQAT